MALTNPWLNTLQRSYNDIKNTLLSKINKLVTDSVGENTINDTTEGNIFTLLISMFSSIAEVIHYYIDSMGRETFFTTARRYSSLQKHCKMLDYHIKSANPASVDLIISCADGKPNRVETGYGNFELRAYNPTQSNNMVFTDQNGNQWVIPTTSYFTTGQPYHKFPIVQKEYLTNSDDTGLQSLNSVILVGGIPSGKYYVEGSMKLWIGSGNHSSENDNAFWRLVDTFAYSGPTDKVYKVELDSTMRPYFVFGDGVNGALPPLQRPFYYTYYVTAGTTSNIAAKTITTLPEPLDPSITVSNYKVVNQYAAAGGTNYETFQMIKQRLPLYLKTMNIAITKEDFESLARTINGVSKAYVDYQCGKRITVYISPENGVNASQELLESVRAELNSRKSLTTYYSVSFIRKENIYIDMTVNGVKSADTNTIISQITSTLTNFYSYDNSDPNRIVALSDIYGLVENLSVVDTLYINSLYFFPEPLPVNGGSIGLEYSYNLDTKAQNYIDEVDQSFYDVELVVGFTRGSDGLLWFLSPYNNNEISQYAGDTDYTDVDHIYGESDSSEQTEFQLNSMMNFHITKRDEDGHFIDVKFKFSVNASESSYFEEDKYRITIRVPFIGLGKSIVWVTDVDKEEVTTLGQSSYEGRALQILDSENLTIKVNEVI